MKTTFLFIFVTGTAWLASGDAVVPTELQAEALLRPVPSSGRFFPFRIGDISQCATNAALERAFGWQEGDAVRAIEGLLERELTKPEGGGTNTVLRALDALAQSGEKSATNTLDRFLFASVSPFRGDLFAARAALCDVDHATFARRVVSDLSVRERRMCYETAAAWIPFRIFDKSTIRPQIGAVLESCAIEENHIANAAYLDRFMVGNYVGWWQDRNARNRVAARFAGVGGQSGAYFKEVLKEIGKPKPIDIAIRSHDHIVSVISDRVDPPPEWYFYSHRRAIIGIAQDYGMEEKDVPLALANLYMKTLKKRENTQLASRFRVWAGYTIRRSLDPQATAILEEAKHADWNPQRDDIP